VTGWIHRLLITTLLFLFTIMSTTSWSGVSQDNIVRGEKIYNKSCISCHGEKKSGAPQLTDKKAWETRIQQPRKRLMQHVLKGFKTMPARGGDSSLNVRNVADALDYMLFTILGLEDLIVDQNKSAQNKKNASAATNKSSNKSTAKDEPVLSATLPTDKNNALNNLAAESKTHATELTQDPVQLDKNHNGQNTLATPTVSKMTSSDFAKRVSNYAYSMQVDEFLAQLKSSKIPTSVDDLAAPQDKYGDDVRLGFRIFTQTAKYAGRYSGNDLSCSNCHLDAGRREHAAPMWGAIGMYPAYKRRNDRNNTLEDRIQQCFQFSLNGFAPAADSPEIRALLSYIHYISRGVPVGVNLPGRGLISIENTGFDPNPSRGLKSFEKYCTSCHQADGSGKRKEKGNGFTVPPLWGRHAYNKAAGFSEIRKLAGFIKANMPPQGANLSSQEALDIAAYINQQIRPGDPRKGLFDAWFGD